MHFYPHETPRRGRGLCALKDADATAKDKVHCGMILPSSSFLKYLYLATIILPNLEKHCRNCKLCFR